MTAVLKQADEHGPGRPDPTDPHAHEVMLDGVEVEVEA